MTYLRRGVPAVYATLSVGKYMSHDLEKIYERLYDYSEARDFAGADPFNGLNSRIFQLTPLKYFRSARLAWLQIIKRSPVDLRGLLLVEPGVNPKGLALFALAEMSRYRATGFADNAENAAKLIDRLMELAITDSGDGGQTLAFGYNFDWQSRVFYAPRGTPAVVPTAFAFRALIESFEANGNENHLTAAAGICRFITGRLNRPVDTADEVCFSYTPVDKTAVYNASLLAAECLAKYGKISGNADYMSLSAKAARFVINRQRGDGAWVYGEDESHAWADNFHTAFILISLSRISDDIPHVKSEVGAAVEKGSGYWLENFFLDDGTPKYYDRAIYPVDIHSAAAAIVGLTELKDRDARMFPMAEKIADWTARNMLDADGFFYYQIRKHGSIETQFMRWGQAWMAYALARLIEGKGRDAR